MAIKSEVSLLVRMVCSAPVSKIKRKGRKLLNRTLTMMKLFSYSKGTSIFLLFWDSLKSTLGFFRIWADRPKGRQKRKRNRIWFFIRYKTMYVMIEVKLCHLRPFISSIFGSSLSPYSKLYFINLKQSIKAAKDSI